MMGRFVGSYFIGGWCGASNSRDLPCRTAAVARGRGFLSPRLRKFA